MQNSLTEYWTKSPINYKQDTIFCKIHNYPKLGIFNIAVKYSIFF